MRLPGDQRPQRGQRDQSREVVGSPVFVFLLVLALLLALVLLVQIYWNSPELRRLAMWSASRLGPEPWLSLVSVGAGLAAGASGAIILQL